MKNVNLLPKWYLDQQKQKRNLRVHLGIIVLLGMAAVGATIAGRKRIALSEGGAWEAGGGGRRGGRSRGEVDRAVGGIAAAGQSGTGVS